MNPNYQKFSFWNHKSVRLYLTLLFGLAVLANALIRNTLAMAMVCMVNSTFTPNTNKNSSLLDSNDGQSSKVSCTPVEDLQQDYQGTFNWGSFEQGIMFAAIFVGGLISTIPAGWLADRYDPKILVTSGILISTLGCFLSPLAVSHGGYIGLVILRFFMGLFGQALISPGISAIIARWIPPMERSTVIAVYSAGNQVANIIGMPMNAVLCRTKFLNGWQMIFYFNGLFGVISGVLWIIFASSRPENNKFISEKEKLYIITCLANQNLGCRKEATKTVPWKKLLTSAPVLTILFGYFAASMMATALSTNIPTYFKEVLEMGLVNNGLFSALPFILQWVAKTIFAITADSIKQRTKISPILICKIFNSLNCFGCASFLIFCSFMDCTKPVWAVILLSLSTTMLAANVPGFMTSGYSIAPAYTGIIMALSTITMQLGSFVAPLIIAALTPNGTSAEWQCVFFVIAIVMMSSGILFLIFGSVSIQDWAKIKQPKSTPNERADNSKNSGKSPTFTDESGKSTINIDKFDNEKMNNTDCELTVKY